MKRNFINKLNRLLLIPLSLVTVGAFSSCGREYEIAVVTDRGQLKDGSFNEGTWNGVVQFAKEHNKSYKYYQPANGEDTTVSDRKQAFDMAVEGGAKVVVAPGYLQAEAIEYAARKYTDVKFIFVDGWAMPGLSNVFATSYKEEQSGYLAGYCMVVDGYTKLGGTFGGAGTGGACPRYAYGFVQGIRDAVIDIKKNATEKYEKAPKPYATFKVSFKYGASYTSSNELTTQMESWYLKGTQAIFSCGGAMLESVKQATKNLDDRKIVGVDVNQAKEHKNIVTSAEKGLATSVNYFLNEWNDGNWEKIMQESNGYKLGVKEECSLLPTDESSWRFKNKENTMEYYNQIIDWIKKEEDEGRTPIDNETPDNVTKGSELDELIKSNGWQYSADNAGYWTQYVQNKCNDSIDNEELVHIEFE